MSFSITKIGETAEIVDEFWKARREGERTQNECAHINSKLWNSTSGGIHICDDCYKMWREDSQKTS
jgi:hypothetical protein